MINVVQIGTSCELLVGEQKNRSPKSEFIACFNVKLRQNKHEMSELVLISASDLEGGGATDRYLFAIAVIVLLTLFTRTANALKPIPEKLVVLTFDDSVKSHFTVVRPILLKYDFGATFFITEGFDFPANKKDYMTWEEIALLHKDGFEIGNHTRDHMSVSEEHLSQLADDFAAK